jgi:hypothetical protein
VVFQCGVKAQWLVIEPEAADAMAVEAHRQRIALADNLADNMAKTQRFLRHAESVRTRPGDNGGIGLGLRRVCRCGLSVDPRGERGTRRLRHLCGCASLAVLRGLRHPRTLAFASLGFRAGLIRTGCGGGGGR